jgi:hypothetical protein
MAFNSPGNPLQQDIRSLITVLRSDKTNTEEKQLSFRRLLAITECLQAERRSLSFISSLQLHGMFSDVQDEDLAKLVSPEHAGLSACMTLGKARTLLLSDPQIRQLLLEMDEASDEIYLLLDQLHDAVRHELFQEFFHRQSDRETQDARLVRELLVERDDRDANLQSLAKRIAAGLSIPADPLDGKRDAESEAAAQIWERVQSFLDQAPQAAPQALLAYLRGEFTKTLEISRQAVRNSVRTELRQRVIAKYDNEQVESAAQPDSGQVPVTQKIFMDQVFSKGGLSKLEKNLIVECVFDGRSQQAVSGELELSQPSVSRSLRNGLAKLSRVLSSPSRKINP